MISTVPPLMVKTADMPDGIDKSVSDDLQANTTENRAQDLHAVPARSSHGDDRDGVELSKPVIDDW